MSRAKANAPQAAHAGGKPPATSLGCPTPTRATSQLQQRLLALLFSTTYFCSTTLKKTPFLLKVAEGEQASVVLNAQHARPPWAQVCAEGELSPRHSARLPLPTVPQTPQRKRGAAAARSLQNLTCYSGNVQGSPPFLLRTARRAVKAALLPGKQHRLCGFTRPGIELL